MLLQLFWIIFNLTAFGTTHGLCLEEPDGIIIAQLRYGDTVVFSTCGRLSEANQQRIHTVCSLNLKKTARLLSPAVQCPQTCEINGDKKKYQSPSSPILGIVTAEEDDGEVIVYQETCGWLEHQTKQNINVLCRTLDKAVWDSYTASNICFDTCASSSSSSPGFPVSSSSSPGFPVQPCTERPTPSPTTPTRFSGTTPTTYDGSTNYEENFYNTVFLPNSSAERGRGGGSTLTIISVVFFSLTLYYRREFFS